MATASAAEVILTAVAIKSFTSDFLRALSVASSTIIRSPATGVTAVRLDIPVAGNVFISVMVNVCTSKIAPLAGAVSIVKVVPLTA